MKQFFLLVVCCCSLGFAFGQTRDCNFAKPVVSIDFGDDRNPRDFLLTQLKDNYRRVNNFCPNDGEFTFTSHTGGCYFGNWLTFSKDHTPGSKDGRMMIVNASQQPGTFFSVALSNLKPNTLYECGAWIANICPGTEGCEPASPQIRVSVYGDGKLLSKFYTGAIAPTNTINWQRYAGNFTTPAVFSGIVVAMDVLTSSGCGNDFALDDIEIRECRIITNTPPPEPRPVIINKPASKAVTAPPIVKKETVKAPTPPVIRNKETSVIAKESPAGRPAAVQPRVKTVAAPLQVPDAIRERDNPVAQKIITPPSEITIELYDNGEIDGDTVTIYHNNKMLVSRAGLSVKPVTVTLQVDKNNPRHELVMVANNLGSIPPNTSLMVVTTKYKRYEVFISSSEQKNAKVLIELEK
jgi:hypothetical protein